MANYLRDLLQYEIDRHKYQFSGREDLFNSTKHYIESNFQLEEETFYCKSNYQQLKKIVKLLRLDPRTEKLGAAEMCDPDNLRRIWIEARDLDQEYGLEPILKTMVDFVGNCYEFNVPGFVVDLE